MPGPGTCQPSFSLTRIHDTPTLGTTGQWTNRVCCRHAAGTTIHCTAVHLGADREPPWQVRNCSAPEQVFASGPKKYKPLAHEQGQFQSRCWLFLLQAFLAR